MRDEALAIDLYGGEGGHAYVQEYAPPKTVNQESARERRREVLAVLPEVLSVPPQQVHSRGRKPQKGTRQYEKRESVAERHVVGENGFEVLGNFYESLESRLFLVSPTTPQPLR